MSMPRLLHCSFRLADARQLLLTRGRATFATTRPGRGTFLGTNSYYHQHLSVSESARLRGIQRAGMHFHFLRRNGLYVVTHRIP